MIQNEHELKFRPMNGIVAIPCRRGTSKETKERIWLPILDMILSKIALIFMGIPVIIEFLLGVEKRF